MLRLCYPPQFSTYGQHGTPSVGTLTDVLDHYRCTYSLALGTALPAGTPAALLVGAAPQAVPLPNAPGNFLYVVPVVTVGMAVANGQLAISLSSPTALGPGAAFAQWALLDPPANGLGIVSSRGVQVQFQ